MENLLENLDHHSFLFLGDRVEVEKQILFELEDKFSIKKTANPDFYYFNKDLLSVDDVRDIAQMSGLKSLSGQKKIFLISVLNILTESQNAFLKNLEEASSGVVFIIICSQNVFLETFLSRMALKDLRYLKTKDKKEKILEKNLSQKLSLVTKICKDIQDEKTSREEALSFVQNLESEIFESFGLVEGSLKLKACLLAKKRLSKKGAMTKMILENLVLQIG